MTDITIKNVPDEFVEDLKELAVGMIEDYKRNNEVQPDEEKVATFKTEVDAIRVANGLAKKYE